MDVSFIIDPLNDAQREAVTADQSPLLVLAGAGSGKTRVLVHRIAWLIQVDGVSPYGILAVTFTNKAAGEMRSRIEQLIGVPTRGMWVGTFHGLAHRLLRAHWQEAGLVQSFQVLDSDDQYRIIRRVLKSLELDESRWPPRQAQWFINARKDEGLRPQHIEAKGDPHQRQQIAIYQAYEELCQRSGLVDFAELLLRAHELWLQHPELLAHYQQRFQHILVDEFQDTNTIQYAWLRVLAGTSGRITIVGDDDQSIYGWRGARIENLQRFERDFPGARTLRLEQNYRSTGAILKAANALIAHNDGRLGKNLWTAGDEGEAIQLYAAINEQDEARFVVERIQGQIDQGQARAGLFELGLDHLGLAVIQCRHRLAVLFNQFGLFGAQPALVGLEVAIVEPCQQVALGHRLAGAERGLGDEAVERRDHRLLHRPLDHGRGRYPVGLPAEREHYQQRQGGRHRDAPRTPLGTGQPLNPLCDQCLEAPPPGPSLFASQREQRDHRTRRLDVAAEGVASGPFESIMAGNMMTAQRAVEDEA